MPKVPNVVVGFRERQSVRNHADGIDRVPNTFQGKFTVRVSLEVRTSNLPNTHKFNIDVDRKGLFEGRTLTPSKVVVLGVHLVRERDLLMVAPREQADLVNPT